MQFDAALLTAAFWSFIGGVGYAGTRLSTALWSGVEIDPRARRLAVAQFALALILSPAAGCVLTPVALGVLPGATPPATAFVLGLVFNAVWPLLVEPAFLRSLIADLARGLAARLSPGDRR